MSAGDKRVLRLFSRLNVGGPSIHVVLLSAGLRERGYNTLLVIGQESETEGNLLDFAASQGVICTQLEGLGREISPLSDLQAFLGLVRLIRSFRPDIVHTHTAKAGMLGRLAAWLCGVPVVIHTFHGHVLRGYFGPVKSVIFRWIEKILALRTQALVAVSRAVKEDLVSLGVAGDSKVRVIPLGLQLERLKGPLPRGELRREAGFSDDAVLVGMVGRLVPIKDVPTFLRAAAIVHTRFPQARFSIVGDGEERELLEDQSRRSGLTGIVHFHGWRREMETVYGDLDIVVNSSRNEGTPVALIEALAAGRPVVATSVGGTPDVLGRGERGWLVPPEDPERLAEAICEALRSPEEADRRAQKGRAYVLAQHGVARLVDDTDRLYRELLAEAEAR